MWQPTEDVPDDGALRGFVPQNAETMRHIVLHIVVLLSDPGQGLFASAAPQQYGQHAGKTSMKQSKKGVQLDDKQKLSHTWQRGRLLSSTGDMLRCVNVLLSRGTEQGNIMRGFNWAFLRCGGVQCPLLRCCRGYARARRSRQHHHAHCNVVKAPLRTIVSYEQPSPCFKIHTV